MDSSSDDDGEAGDKPLTDIIKKSRGNTLESRLGNQILDKGYKIKNIGTYASHTVYFILPEQQVFVLATPTINTLTDIAGLLE